MHSIRLTALSLLAVAVYPFLTADVPAGQSFILSFADDKKDELQRTVDYLTVTNKFAEVSADQTGLSEAPPDAPQTPPNASGQPPAPTPPAKPAARGKLTECRVLQACEYGAVNTIASLTAAELKAGKDQGLVCDDKASVDYAKSLA